MSEDAGAPSVSCPGCRLPLDAHDQRYATCGNCSWRGHVLRFRPLALNVKSAETALPEDAVCTQHPAKRAVEVCAGTGDYICSLCCIEIGGAVYAAHYVNTVGRDMLVKAFDRTLERPDNVVLMYCGLCLVPYVNVLWLLASPVWVPLAFVRLFRAARLRRQDVLMARLVSRGRLILLGVLVMFFLLLLVVAVIGVILSLDQLE